MQNWRGELRKHLRLAVPVGVIQLGTIALNVVDAAMVGHRSAADLAGVAVGNAFAFGLLAFGLGTVLAVDPIISQAVGARDERGIDVGLQRGLLLALLLCLPIAALVALAHPVLGAMGVDAEVLPLASGYALTSIPSIPAFLLFTVLRQPLQALHRMRTVVFAILLTNIANVGLNWVLIHGHLGLPAMGAVGCGWSTTICRWFSLFALLWLARADLAPHLHWHRESFDRAAMSRLLRLGTPIGLHLLMEMGGFGLISILMGRLGPTEAAGHQIALNLSSVSFMIPLAMSMSAAVRVGKEIGAGRLEEARLAARVATVGAAIVMALFGIVFATVPAVLASLYTTDTAVVGVAVGLLRLAALFQVFDGLQVVAAGIMRGAGSTRPAMVIYFFGFWLFGLPLGIYLTFGAGLGPVGLWWGLLAGLGTVAIVLVLFARRRMGSELRRISLDTLPEPALEPNEGRPAG